MADYRIYQPKVKSAQDVLMGIAQVRIGLPSVRSSNLSTSASTAALTKPVRAVGKSDVFTDPTDGTTECVRPSAIAQANAASTAPTASGTYTGTMDGCFIIRLTSASAGTLYAPDGTKTAIAAVSPIAVTSQGLTFAGTITGGASGDTWVIPVWAAVATPMSKVQTGICSPYSMFLGSNESIGGLKSASFNPKIEDQKVLSSGWPETEDDRVIVKTSVEIQFEALEYKNSTMTWLKNLVNEAINNASTASVPVELVARTRGNSIISFWCPSCTVSSFPTIDPRNDYSSFTWSLTANKMTEATGESATYNAWLRNTNVFYEQPIYA